MPDSQASLSLPPSPPSSPLPPALAAPGQVVKDEKDNHKLPCRQEGLHGASAHPMCRPLQMPHFPNSFQKRSAPAWLQGQGRA